MEYELKIAAAAPGLRKMNLGELYGIASELGDPCVGKSLFNKNEAGIKMHKELTSGDYVSVKECHGNTVEENLARCIERARALALFYKEMRQ